jgi:MFS family permease
MGDNLARHRLWKWTVLGWIRRWGDWVGQYHATADSWHCVQTPAPKATSLLYAFAGAVVGSLIFGYTSDHWSRKYLLLVSTAIIITFSALGAGSYGAGGSTQGLFAALTAYRFFLGVDISGEHPAGAVACGELTGELKKGHRNRWFIFLTDFAIDVGVVVAAFVPMVVELVTSEDHLRAAWGIVSAAVIAFWIILAILRRGETSLG